MRRLSIDYKAFNERQQAAIILQQIRELPTVAETIGITFGANDSQVAQCEAFNRGERDSINFGLTATGQAKVMQELINLLQRDYNQTLRARICILPIVTAKSLIGGMGNSAVSPADAQDHAKAFKAAAQEHVLNSHGTVMVLTNPDAQTKAKAGEWVPIGGGTVKGDARDAISKTFNTTFKNLGVTASTPSITIKKKPAHPLTAQAKAAITNRLTTYKEQRDRNNNEYFHVYTKLFGAAFHSKTNKLAAANALINVLENKLDTPGARALLDNTNKLHSIYMDALSEKDSNLFKAIQGTGCELISEFFSGKQVVEQLIKAAQSSLTAEAEAKASPVLDFSTPKSTMA